MAGKAPFLFDVSVKVFAFNLSEHTFPELCRSAICPPPGCSVQDICHSLQSILGAQHPDCFLNLYTITFALCGLFCGLDDGHHHSSAHPPGPHRAVSTLHSLCAAPCRREPQSPTCRHAVWETSQQGNHAIGGFLALAFWLIAEGIRYSCGL